jgi:NAD(P)-dependent dehydrogenase (short-subunit alcohol dehydrogenase family)
VAVVTGGTRGIGAAITRAIAKLGCTVAAGFSRSEEHAAKLAAELEGDGHSVSLHQGNVGDPADCCRVADEVLARWGRIDFLINNAGVTVDKTVRNMSIDDWHAVLRVNLSGAFYMTKAILEPMIELGSGRIVNISSVIADIGNIGQANYAASKSGLFGFSKSLALEVARRGITVNCVAPGFIDTDMLAGIPDAALKSVMERIPVRRLGRPDEVARAVCFLIDDDSDYITGTVIAVNGGLEMV